MSDGVAARTLADAASVERVAEGRYRAELSGYFSVMGRPNGGYLQCLIAAAAEDAATAHGARHRDVLAVATTFLASPSGPSVALAATVRRAGRSATFVHVAISHDDRLTSESLVTLGDHGSAPARYTHAAPSSLAARDACVASVPVNEVNIRLSVDMRLDPTCVGWFTGQVGDRAEILAWLRLRDSSGAAWDARSVLFASDCLPPATFPIGSVGWVPTLQLTTYVHRAPSGPWLAARQWCVAVSGGVADERCELVDESGQLVATASQLMLCRFPSGD